MPITESCCGTSYCVSRFSSFELVRLARFTSCALSAETCSSVLAHGVGHRRGEAVREAPGQLDLQRDRSAGVPIGTSVIVHLAVLREGVEQLLRASGRAVQAGVRQQARHRVGDLRVEVRLRWSTGIAVLHIQRNEIQVAARPAAAG